MNSCEVESSAFSQNKETSENIHVFRRSSQLRAFHFALYPKPKSWSFFLWHFDQTLRYFIKFRHLGSGWFWVQCKMENLEWKCLPPAHKPVRTLTLLKFFRHLPACTQQDQSLLIHSWGSRNLKQIFSRSPIIWVFFVHWEHDNLQSLQGVELNNKRAPPEMEEKTGH